MAAMHGMFVLCPACVASDNCTITDPLFKLLRCRYPYDYVLEQAKIAADTAKVAVLPVHEL